MSLLEIQGKATVINLDIFEQAPDQIKRFTTKLGEIANSVNLLEIEREDNSIALWPTVSLITAGDRISIYSVNKPSMLCSRKLRTTIPMPTYMIMINKYINFILILLTRPRLFKENGHKT